MGGPESDPKSDPESYPEMVSKTDAKWCQNHSSKQSKPFENLMFCKGAAPAGGPVKGPEMVPILVPKNGPKTDPVLPDGAKKTLTSESSKPPKSSTRVFFC